ncbi:MAG: hypothetical protein ACK4Z6_03495, partial [Candidatus Methylomirabilales bacterium]
MKLEHLRKNVEGFLEELAREEYRQRAGLKERSEQARIDKKYAYLASPDLFQEVKGMAEGVEDPKMRKGLRFLLEFLAQNTLEAEVRELYDEILSLEASLLFEVEEQTFSFRSLEAAIKNEEDRRRRQLLDEARRQGIRTLNPLLARVWERTYEAASRLGFPSYPVLFRELSGIDLLLLKKQGDELLLRTEDMYADLLQWHLKKRLGLPLKEAKRHDLARLFRAPEWDGSFPPERMRSSAEATLQKMRIDPQAGGRIVLDDEPRPHKSPRAFVAPWKVPDRIIIVIRPMGGFSDYEAYLHELGHALHYAYTDAALPVEFRRLGDPSVTEAYAFLMEGLLLEEGWLQRFLDLKRSLDFLRLAFLHRLYLLRRYAAKLVYELLLHDGSGFAGKAEAYRELLSRATLVEQPWELYLYDVDPHFYIARYWRAWLFHAHLKKYLYERYDEEWFRNDRTGPFLMELWAYGLS